MSAKALLSASVSAAPKVYIEDTFSTFLYTGTGSTQTITNGIDLAGEGGLVWVKHRDQTVNHVFYDTQRGATKSLSSNTSGSEITSSDTLTSFNSSGFSLGADSFNNFVNNAGFGAGNNDYASWTFRKAPKFFDVVTYTGTGSNTTIAHNLGSVPGAIWVKRTDTTGDWQCYHRSLANTQYMVLNSDAAVATGATRWNSTTPTSSVFSLGTDATVNASAGTYVAYLFAHDAGGFGDSGADNVVSCGTFTGGSTLNVTLGWEPQWVLVKGTSSGSWVLADIMRGASQTSISYLYANGSDAESTGGGLTLAPTATGFTVNPANLWGNQTYIYIAIRRGPMKTPTDATKVFDVTTTTNASAPTITTSFPVDAIWLANRSSVTDKYGINTRLTGTSGLVTCTTAAEFTNANYKYDYQNGWGGFTSLSGHVFTAFRRAPGFFDVVAYTGTGSARTVSHNLGVVPELMIIKERSASQHWSVYHKDLNAGGSAQQSGIYLSFDMEQFDSSIGWWNNTAPTSSVFSTGNASATNQSANTYIAYLFASCPGVSKVGSYTGTGTTKQIDCGFTGGARFVLIKRTDAYGSWYVWDTARGIISGNDPYLLLNSTAAEVTNTDYIDPLSSGFEISSTAPAAINANGGTYIFLAIA